MACFEAESIPLFFELAAEKGARHESVGTLRCRLKIGIARYGFSYPTALEYLHGLSFGAR